MPFRTVNIRKMNVNEMSPALYETLAKGKEGFLLTHTTFADDMKSAVEQLGNLL